MSHLAVLSTRPEGERDPLVARLRRMGYRVHAVPTLVLEPLDFPPPDLAAFDWVVVTSAMGARVLLERVPPRPGPRWAAVGPRTAAELSRRGVVPLAVPEQRRGAAIAEEMARVPGRLRGARVLLARADAAAPDLPTALRRAGAVVEELAVYHTLEGPPASRPGLRVALADPELAAVVFASGSAARGLLRLAPEARRLPAVTIGPSTTAAARAEGFAVLAEAPRADVEGLVEAVRAALGPPIRSEGGKV
ncbi:MAG TPA: uroporphyrinogen-III synthase [Candidatus Dormibacteraeota bacterium]|nr:uroporphyrinogen-III synthase [Candidatus Dormibacteraeota bacterium]